ncbi:MAG: ParB/RepB/Spo0J family partition protein [Lachnospiraceae bacterium]|nr:ParB/RepB/Spo0J family partition protein [Lachnospiraceae bacterium]
MNQRPKIDLGMSGYEELFMNDQERADLKKPKVEEVPLSEFSPFKDHPFKVREDEELERLKDSIRESGVLVPALARPKSGGGYELISGHRRMAACMALGLETMPVIIRDLTDEEAVITMVDANLQREHILPSEKAFAYKMKMEALSHQGASRQVGEKWSVSQISEGSKDSERQIHRYIRLTNLTPELLQMVDDGKIALTPAVELSYLSEKEQDLLLEQMDYTDATPSLSQAQRMRHMSREQELSSEELYDIMSEVKGNQVEYVKVPMDRIRDFFRPDTSVKQMQDMIVKAMEHYSRYLERQRDRDAR